jgi:hypothetical protein
MANVLGNYNPIFYVQEGLTILEKALGMSGRVYRGLDDSNSSREKGDTATISVPGSFTAQDAPSVAQDLQTSKVDVKLDQWKEVKFSLTDKELSYSTEKIINDHIRPAIYALVDKIDISLCQRWTDIPWYFDWSNPSAVADITNGRKILFNNKSWERGRMRAMVDGGVEGELLALSAFAQNQGAGADGVNTQREGDLGRKYGFDFFADQNCQSATNPAVADGVGAINNGPGYPAGTKSINVNGMTIAAAFKQGDIVQVTGHVQQYVLTADATMDGAGAGTLLIDSFNPFSGLTVGTVVSGGLEAAVVNAQVVTVIPSGGSGTTKVQTILYHEGAFALAMAKLPDFYDGQGVRVFSVTDPKTNLSLRARTWVDPDNSRFRIAFDTLYGFKTLNSTRAVRGRR